MWLGLWDEHLKEWKKKDITGIYHKWQNMVRIQFLLLNCMIYKKRF
jgi:hypothetical protein